MMDSAEVGNPLTRQELQLDNLQAIRRLREIGQAYATKHVRREHLLLSK